MNNSTFLSKLSTKLIDPTFHARWLNTLSYLENCGARMIARCEHPTMVSREILKHAAEEFRHAYYLKSLIHRIRPSGIPDYTIANLVCGYGSYHYMTRLNTNITRYLKQEYQLNNRRLKEHAYLLVTYAVEVRALQLYEDYEKILRSGDYPLSIRSILKEEVQHLKEINDDLRKLPDAKTMKAEVETIETALWRDLITGLS